MIYNINPLFLFKGGIKYDRYSERARKIIR